MHVLRFSSAHAGPMSVRRSHTVCAWSRLRCIVISTFGEYLWRRNLRINPRYPFPFCHAKIASSSCFYSYFLSFRRSLCSWFITSIIHQLVHIFVLSNYSSMPLAINASATSKGFAQRHTGEAGDAAKVGAFSTGFPRTVPSHPALSFAQCVARRFRGCCR